MKISMIRSLSIITLLWSVFTHTHAAVLAKCEVQEPVRFAGMSWESNLLLVNIERFILEKGYGCRTENVPAESLPALAALARGDLDVVSEIWLNSLGGPWLAVEKENKVKRIGVLYHGGEAWFIPRYTAERLPNLKSAADLPRFKEEFKDIEEPDKGRFYTCPVGWECEVINSHLFHAFGLENFYTLYSPGTGAAQKATLMSTYKRKRNMVFYYWYPTPLTATLDLVKLEMPPYDAEKHKCLIQAECAHPVASNFSESPVSTGVNTKFANRAPKLMKFFSKISIPLPVIQNLLARMERQGESAKESAQWFLKNQSELWMQWVPTEVAQQVQTALK